MNNYQLEVEAQRVKLSTFKEIFQKAKAIAGVSDERELELQFAIPLCNGPEAASFPKLYNLLLSIQTLIDDGYKITPRIYLYAKGESLAKWYVDNKNLPIPKEQIIEIEKMRQLDIYTFYKNKYLAYRDTETIRIEEKKTKEKNTTIVVKVERTTKDVLEEKAIKDIKDFTDRKDKQESARQKAVAVDMVRRKKARLKAAELQIENKIITKEEADKEEVAISTAEKNYEQKLREQIKNSMPTPIENREHVIIDGTDTLLFHLMHENFNGITVVLSDHDYTLTVHDVAQYSSFIAYDIPGAKPLLMTKKYEMEPYQLKEEQQQRVTTTPRQIPNPDRNLVPKVPVPKEASNSQSTSTSSSSNSQSPSTSPKASPTVSPTITPQSTSPGKEESFLQFVDNNNRRYLLDPNQLQLPVLVLPATYTYFGEKNSETPQILNVIPAPMMQQPVTNFSSAISSVEINQQQLEIRPEKSLGQYSPERQIQFVQKEEEKETRQASLLKTLSKDSHKIIIVTPCQACNSSGLCNHKVRLLSQYDKEVTTENETIEEEIEYKNSQLDNPVHTGTLLQSKQQGKNTSRELLPIVPIQPQSTIYNSNPYVMHPRRRSNGKGDSQVITNNNNNNNNSNQIKQQTGYVPYNGRK